MTQNRERKMIGPISFAVGGCFVTFPILSFFYLLYDGRLSHPYTGAFEGYMVFVLFLVFVGLLVAATGIQMILEDSRK
ncbi:MAG: hypothetical protein ACP6KW_08650 [Candidatus Thorarchaeota archaeon]